MIINSRKTLQNLRRFYRSQIRFRSHYDLKVLLSYSNNFYFEDHPEINSEQHETDLSEEDQVDDDGNVQGIPPFVDDDSAPTTISLVLPVSTMGIMEK